MDTQTPSGTTNKSKLYVAKNEMAVLHRHKPTGAKTDTISKSTNAFLQQKGFLSIKTFFNKFKDKEKTVLKAIASGEGLTKQELEELIQFLPTSLELNTIKEQQKNLEVVGLPEQFFVKLSEIPHYESKIKFMLEKEKYRIKFESLSEKVDSIIQGCQLLRENTNITYFLSYVIYAAKHIVPSTKNGIIKLEDIPNLLDGKPSEDDSPSYFHAAIDVVQLRDNHFLDFTKKAKRLRRLSKTSIKNIENKLRLLCAGVGAMEKVLHSTEVDSTQFHDLVRFVLETTNAITKKVDLANDAAKTIAELYSQDVATFKIHQCFMVLANLFDKIEKVSLENSIRDSYYDISSSKYKKENVNRDKLQSYKDLNYPERKIVSFEPKITSAVGRKNAKKTGTASKFISPYSAN